MTDEWDMRGIDATAYSQSYWPTTSSSCRSQQKPYSGMLSQSGGVIDDVIVYSMGGWYRDDFQLRHPRKRPRMDDRPNQGLWKSP